MTIIIVGSIWLGMYLDQKVTSSFPWFTVGLSLIGVAAAITHVIVALKRFLE
jgi:F0F1-type ATP synthase assembly protein I